VPYQWPGNEFQRRHFELPGRSSLGTGALRPLESICSSAHRRTKVTQEQIFPERKIALALAAEQKDLPPPSRDEYTRETESSGLSVAAGAGLDLKLNDAVAVRLAKLDYAHSWINNVGGVSYANEVHFTTGIVIRLGTW